MVAGRRGPWAEEVVSHEVDQVKVMCGAGEIDVLQSPRAAGQGGGDCEARRREISAEDGEQFDVCAAFICIGGMLPIDWFASVHVPLCLSLTRWGTLAITDCLCHLDCAL